jgi:hypothetical protein
MLDREATPVSNPAVFDTLLDESEASCLTGSFHPQTVGFPAAESLPFVKPEPGKALVVARIRSPSVTR